MAKHAQIDRDAIDLGEGEHKVFSKEVSGKKVVDLLFHKVSAGNMFDANATVMSCANAFLVSGLLEDAELSQYWSNVAPETLSHQQDVMMEIAFGAGLLPEDITYLKEVHASAMSYKGLTDRHFDMYLKHFETVLKELGSIIPSDKSKSAVANMKACKVIFKK